MVHISSSSTDVIEEMLRLPTRSKNCRSKLYEQFTHFQQEAWQSSRELAESNYCAQDLVKGTSVKDLVTCSTAADRSWKWTWPFESKRTVEAPLSRYWLQTIGR